jgi:hypothetical protein
MNQEYKSTCSNIPATTIPYWDERCGDFFYNINNIEEKFNSFLDLISYILKSFFCYCLGCAVLTCLCPLAMIKVRNDFRGNFLTLL